MAPKTIATYDVHCGECGHEWVEHDLDCDGVLQSTVTVCPKCESPMVNGIGEGRFLVHIPKEDYVKFIM